MILGIYGNGGLGREVLENAKEINAILEKWDEIIFIDDCADDIAKENVIKTFLFSQVKETYSSKEIEICVAVGEPAARQKLYECVNDAGYPFALLIHPTVSLSASAEISSGVIIGAFAFISCGAKIGMNTYIQPHALIGHDTVIGVHAVISSNVVLAGNCLVGDGTYIGMGAIVRESTAIGARAVISMAAAVYREVPDGVIVVGNPARIVKNNNEVKVFK
jgi:sugar O-acyltransferase (sialic acid O-acetyltransferase NeuD family)